MSDLSAENPANRLQPLLEHKIQRWINDKSSIAFNELTSDLTKIASHLKLPPREEKKQPMKTDLSTEGGNPPELIRALLSDRAGGKIRSLPQEPEETTKNKLNIDIPLFLGFQPENLNNFLSLEHIMQTIMEWSTFDPTTITGRPDITPRYILGLAVAGTQSVKTRLLEFPSGSRDEMLSQLPKVLSTLVSQSYTKDNSPTRPRQHNLEHHINTLVGEYQKNASSLTIPICATGGNIRGEFYKGDLGLNFANKFNTPVLTLDSFPNYLNPVIRVKYK